MLQQLLNLLRRLPNHLLKVLLVVLQVVDQSVTISLQKGMVLFILVILVSLVRLLLQPMSYRKVVCDPLWLVAMAKELDALYQTQTTWDLVPLLDGKRAIGSRWSTRLRPNLTGPI